MKKLIVGLVAAVMLAAGLVSASGTTASAAAYPGSCATTTSAIGLGPYKGKAKVFVRVLSNRCGKPKGKIDFTFVNKGNGNSLHFRRDYSGGERTYTFKSLNRGRYSALVTYLPPTGSMFKPSTNKTKVTVN